MGSMFHMRAGGLAHHTAGASTSPHALIAQAALDAGFSDHAHLTRTMRALFGQPPSYVIG